MPKLSIVIPTNNVQPCTRKCLDSVLGQSFQDIEVIAVKDDSSDSVEELLDEYVRRDPRVRIIHLPKNTGPGRARNAGAGKATGEYLLFLDHDDSYLPGSLEAVAEHLEKTGNPDLLVFDHVRAYRDGEAATSASGDLLASAGDSTFTLLERPDMAHLVAIACNKAFRRRFWLENQLFFLPGLYEDSPVAYEAMISARSIACLNRPCLEYHQSRGRSSAVVPSRKHFDIFVQYASVYAYIEQRPELDDLREVVFDRMIDHFLECLERSSRVRPSDRRVYFRRIREFYRSFRPRRVDYPKHWRGVEFRLVELGLYTPYAALKTAQRTQRGAKAVRSSARQALRPRVHDLYHRLRRMLPVNAEPALHSAHRNRVSEHGSGTVHHRSAAPAPEVCSSWAARYEDAGERPPGTDRVPAGATTKLSGGS